VSYHRLLKDCMTETDFILSLFFSIHQSIDHSIGSLAFLDSGINIPKVLASEGKK
jgi:hypothetical protein